MYKRNKQGWLKHLDFIILDIIVLQIAFIISYRIRQVGIWPYTKLSYRILAIVLAGVDFLIAAIFNTMRNVLKRGLFQELVDTLKHVALVFMVMTLYMFSTQTGDTYSRIVLYLTAFFHLALGYCIRMIWKPLVRKVKKEGLKSSMLLVADERQVSEILSKVDQTDDVRYVGLVLSNRDASGEMIAGLKVVADLNNAADYICREWIDEVFVYPAHMTDMEIQGSPLYDSIEGYIDDAHSVFDNRGKKRDENADPVGSDDATVASLIEACRQMAVPVHIRLPISDVGGKSFIEKVGGYRVLTTTYNYTSVFQLATKRTLDIFAGLVGSVIAFLVIAVVGPRIKKESPGPILYRQTRIGQNGKKFRIYKIRTMYMDADEHKKELLDKNRISDGMMFKLDWDPRIIGNKIVDGKQVTGIGEKLRSGSWDELPQFFNILRGQMSLVGTRPPTVDEWEKYKYHHRARLATKPGLTGMWQVSGRSKITDFEEVVKLDTEYISHWSVALDLRILLKTVKVVLTKDGAM